MASAPAAPIPIPEKPPITTGTGPAQRPTDDRLTRSLMTPEGVDLKVRLATRGERLGAFLLDILFWGLTVAAVALFLWLLVPYDAVETVMVPILLTLVMLGRVFYFILWEWNRNGQTPGKRVLGLRVIDRRGGPLTLRAVLARNFVRELEVFQPLQLVALLNAGAIDDPFFEGYGALLLQGFLLCITLLPLFNRERMRLGDLLAGTWVISLPKPELRADLAELVVQAQTREMEKTGESQPRYRFTAENLDAYGIHELQVLEDVLRRPVLGPGDAKLLRDIAERIMKRAKVSDPVPQAETRAFLEAYYAALRNHLETRKRFGDERTDKHFRTRKRS